MGGNLYFDRINTVSNPAIVLCGRRRSGKTYIIKKFLKTKSENVMKVVFSDTAHLTNDFENCDIVIKGYNPEILQKIINTPYPFEKLIIFDDCVDTKTRYLNSFLQLFTQGRHLKITVIVATQYPSLLGANMRANTDFIYSLSYDGYDLYSDNKKKDWPGKHLIYRGPEKDEFLPLN